MKAARLLAFAGVCGLAACDRASTSDPATKAASSGPLALAGGSSAAAASKGGAAPVRLVKLEPSAGPLDKLLADHAAKAKADGDKPFVYLSATWCGPCKRLHAALGDPRMVDAFRGASLVELDIDAWDAALQKAQLGAKAIPAFFELDPSGKSTGRKIDGGAWGDDVPENMAPPLKKFFAGG